MLTTVIYPSNSVHAKEGISIETSTVIRSSSVVRPTPNSGLKVHAPHSGYDSISQFRIEPGPPMLLTSNSPYTVIPLSILL